MVSPPRDKRTRSGLWPTAFRYLTLDSGDGDVVIKLDEHRTRRRARFWPGWWGDHYLATWTAAERSRCGKCLG